MSKSISERVTIEEDDDIEIEFEDEKKPSRTKELAIKKLTQHGQILLRPSTQLGSVKVIESLDSMWIVDTNDQRMVSRRVSYSEGLVRTFIEVVSNAIDNVWRSQEFNIYCSRIVISIQKDKVSVTNDGKSIPIEIHETEKIYNHEVIFGQLNTSTNYDDTEKRKTSGLNGFGAKLTNIMSKEFVVESYDPKNKKIYSQKWENNMYICHPPVITNISKPISDSCLGDLTNLGKKSGITKISWKPDFQRFGGLTEFTDDILAVMYKYVYDTAMVVSKYDVKVYLNSDEPLPITSLKDYAFMYYPSPPEEVMTFSSSDCEVVLVPSLNIKFMDISFVNGISTSKGGAHVEKWVDAILRPIVDKINKIKNPVDAKTKTEAKKKIQEQKAKAKKQQIQINIGDVKKYFWIFINCSVDNPDWGGGNIKNELKDVDIEVKLKKTDHGKLMKWNFVQTIKDSLQHKDMSNLTKLTSSKEKLECLDDAGYLHPQYYNSKERKNCILCAVEGLSASTFIVSGSKYGSIEGVSGREYIGILTCRGKFLNPREKNSKQISKNKEATALIRALNLRHDLDYTIEANLNTLRYRKFRAVADADVDGAHIVGLWYNFIESINPSLLRVPGFFGVMQTPILVIKPNDKQITRMFYSSDEARIWLNENKVPDAHVKRYKGLATIERDDIATFFGNRILKFQYTSNTHDVLINIFGKDKTNADFRKNWISSGHGTANEQYVDMKGEDTVEIDVIDFINNDVKEFSREHCRRNIPCLYDSFNESQRKIIYAAFKRNLKKPFKVSQFAGYVSEKTSYHHGEQILNDTIKHMAQRHVGSNNISLLFPKGQFGSRYGGGKDGGAGRYIFTYLDECTRLLYPEVDDKYLPNLEDDGVVIEKEYYLPIIPMILVNGAVGIGTGYSTFIPSYNPRDLVEWLKIRLDDEFPNELEQKDGEIIIHILPTLHPWYLGYKGTIVRNLKTNTYRTYGKIEHVKGNEYMISELPVGKKNRSIREYKTILEDLTIVKDKESSPQIEEFIDKSGDNLVDFRIYSSEDGLNIDLSTQSSTFKTLEALKLCDTIHVTNMTLFTDMHTIKKYNTVDDILEEFFKTRLKKYVERREGEIKELQHKINLSENKIRFIESNESNKSDFSNKEDEAIAKALDQKGYFRNKLEKSEKKNDEEDEGDQKDDFEESESKSKGDVLKEFNYLLRLTHRAGTKKRITILKNELAKFKVQLEEIINLTPRKLWNKELDNFMDTYNSWEKDTVNWLFSQTYSKSVDSKKKKDGIKRGAVKNKK